MTPEEATEELNKEYAHHAHILGERKAIDDPEKVMSLREFKVQIDKVSFYNGCKVAVSIKFNNQFEMCIILNNFSFLTVPS